MELTGFPLFSLSVRVELDETLFICATEEPFDQAQGERGKKARGDALIGYPLFLLLG
jgi:hypothetical protein